VAQGRVWLTTAVVSGRAASLRLIGFDATDGRVAVNTEVFKVYQDEFTTNAKNSDASPTPIVDGDRVYVHFGANGTAAVSTAGAVLWKTQLRYESQHGNGGSPVLYRDLLIINCDGFDQAYVVALDRNTGKERWRRSRRPPFSHAYSTPLTIRVGEQDQLVSVGAYVTTAYEPLTGREIWRVSYRDGFSNVPRPVYGHGLVFITTGFQQPSLLAIRPDGTGDVTKTHVAWTLSRGAPLTPSPILAGDDLYVVSDIGILTCVDARTGEVRWTTRLGGNYSASPVLAGGLLYFASEEGVTTVVAPGAALTRVAANTLDGPSSRHRRSPTARSSSARRRRSTGFPAGGAGFVVDQRLVTRQDRIDDPPGGLHAVLTPEERTVSAHRVAQQAFVRRHLAVGRR
jgi:outer membrane protein assembly factor BamB